MEKKRTGLRSYIRSNLPIELVKFLKKKRVLTRFVSILTNNISNYINPKEAFDGKLKTSSNGSYLIIVVKLEDFGVYLDYWRKLRREYEFECANSK